jgi:transposase
MSKINDAATSEERISALENRITELEALVKYYEEQFKLSRKKIFGQSSEKSVYDQLSFDKIFNEAEKEAATDEPAPERVKEHWRKKRSGAERMPEDLPVEEILCELSEEETVCPECGGKMHVMGHEIAREELVVIPAKAMILRYMTCTYACRACERTNDHVPIKKSEPPAPAIKGSFASPEIVAYTAVQKYLMGLPLYRQEKDWERKDIYISRQTMANWLIKCSDDWLLPIWLELKRRILLRDVLHADETSIQVLKEPGKLAQSKSSMWHYRTSGDADEPIVLMEYRPDKRSLNPERFLAGFSGYLHTDGADGYHRLPESVIPVGCWAHLRRKWDAAVKVIRESDRADSLAMKGKRYCDRLFEIERNIAELPYEDRYARRLELSKPIMDEFFPWAASIKTTPKSALGKAAGYALTQQKYLRNVLLDGRLELSNNRAERSIKSFVIDRKNFLFANTPRGADASAVIFSLIETAKETGVDPFGYLTYVFRTAPSIDINDQEAVKSLLPSVFKNIRKD